MDSITIFLQTLTPPHQALAATIFTWSLTALGASFVLFARNISPRLLTVAQAWPPE
ncbi:hypothetical protein [Deinococcus radiophilus]|uniref:hypothetical protein n=1 Tax=Deinococcus radiophilus TaxID=32062 RepID=UPI00361DC1E7